MKAVYVFLLSIVYLIFIGGCSTERYAAEDSVYLYSSFRDNGQDGLHLAYSLDGYHWDYLGGPYLKPEVGKNALMRDPSVIQGPDGVFHMVWTTGWFGEKGIGYAHSLDLINWSQQKLIEVMAHEPETMNVWAPELYYNEKDEVFVICWASTIKGRYPNSPNSPKQNHRMYCTTTKDFETFTETKLFFEEGFSVIDAIIVERADDDYVLVLKDESRTRSLRVAFGDSYMGPFGNISEPFTEEFTEGPSILKLGDEWVIYFDMHMKHQYGAVKTRDFKSWTNITGEISFPKGHRHGTAFKVSRSILEGLKRVGEN